MKRLNKKGFTLIELLAVIAILAILFIIVTPNILKMFNDGRKNAFKTQAQSVLKTAEAQYMTDVFNNQQGPYCTGTDGKKLDLSGDSSLNYYVSFNSDGNVAKLIVYDNNYYFDSESAGTTAIDKLEGTAIPSGKTLSINCTSGTLTGLD